MMITKEGIIIRISVKDISVLGRNTSGVKLMNIDTDTNTYIASIAKVRDDGNKDGNESEEKEDEASEEGNEENGGSEE